MRKALIYHTCIDENSRLDDLDVLEEVKVVSEALAKIGETSESRAFIPDLQKIKEDIKETGADYIFNLVERVDGTDSLMVIAPIMFESIGIPYTGCPLSALVSTADKVEAKKSMNKEGIPTPKYIILDNLSEVKLEEGEKYLLKRRKEHASVGIDERTFRFSTTKQDIKERLIKEEEKGNACFFEQYLEGREFNISILNGEVLQIPEMLFVDYGDRPRIVGYQAKWGEGTFESINTVRKFEFPKEDRKLLEELKELTKKCWDKFNLKGYARVDFRTDENEKPYVLEINTNPCISADAGFVVAAGKAGMKQEEVIQKITHDLNI